MEKKKQIVTEAELAEAFKPTKETKKPTKAKDKKQVWSLVVFVLGIFTLVAGVVFLIISLVATPGLQDGEYLVSAKQWVLENNTNCLNEESEEKNEEATNCETGQVIWQFTEIGKGALTTNSHVNDYDFIWAIEDGKLKIETDWLYELENEYEYNLDQGSGTMTLKDGEKEYTFVADFATE